MSAPSGTPTSTDDRHDDADHDERIEHRGQQHAREARRTAPFAFRQDECRSCRSAANSGHVRAPSADSPSRPALRRTVRIASAGTPGSRCRRTVAPARPVPRRPAPRSSTPRSADAAVDPVSGHIRVRHGPIDPPHMLSARGCGGQRAVLRRSSAPPGPGRPAGSRDRRSVADSVDGCHVRVVPPRSATCEHGVHFDG